MKKKKDLQLKFKNICMYAVLYSKKLIKNTKMIKISKEFKNDREIIIFAIENT